MKLNIKATAIAFGLCWGGFLLIITWWIMFLEGSSDTATFIGKFYLGYSLTPIGSFIGFIWGLIRFIGNWGDITLKDSHFNKEQFCKNSLN